MKTRVAFRAAGGSFLRRLWLVRNGLSLAVLAWLAVAVLPAAAQPTPPKGAAILQELKSFRQMGSVLYVAAHPDDENTLLIAYLARGRDYRTAYLSLTRGDGGQNVLGPQFGEQLGVARTQELLAARRLDGGRQYFTRAMDFGFSKDYRETLRIWDREQVLSDVVRVIREFRPDVIITRFSTQPGGTHGHHTASAVLALEAFKLAGDPRAFPEQHLPPWQPKRIFVNGRGGDGGVQLEIAGDDPVTGLSFADLAARSRAMHKTQGFDSFRGFGGDGPRTESFQLLAGESATNDILDGIDTTWDRVPGGAEIGRLAGDVITNFNPLDTAASVPALLKLRAALAALPDKNSVVAEKAALLDHILQECLRLDARTTIPDSDVVPGEILKLHLSVALHSSVPVRWVGVRYPDGHEMPLGVELSTDAPCSTDSTSVLPANTPLSQPYWLREEHTPGMFVVDDPDLIGQPENPPVFPLAEIFSVGGQTLVVSNAPVQLVTNSAGKEINRPLEAIPPVSLSFGASVALFAPGKPRAVEVTVTAWRSGLLGTLQLELPTGWQSTPASQPLTIAAAGARQMYRFTVTAPPHPATAEIGASADIGGARFRNDREEISYPHIPRQLLQPPARLKAVSLELAVRSHTIGYFPGAGDTVADCLREMGCAVTIMRDADLAPEKLRGFDAVVIGVRAFNVSPDLAAHLPALFSYVAGGGTVVVQYNRPDNLKANAIAPYELHLSGDRVTDETAPVTFLAPDHPALNVPNKITSADFDGWIQERGIYFPNRWDDHFVPLLACGDPGEAPLRGSLLVARSGKGYFVYTGLVFFRELPAGVPGAYRLFANLISLGK